MNQNRLTETNLKDLDEKIQKEKFSQEKKAALLADKKANADKISQASKTGKNKAAVPANGGQ